MNRIETIDDLEALYGEAVPVAVEKVSPRLTPLYRRWIEASRFVVLSTVGPEGTDASPRGDDGPVVRIADDHTILLPDWRGNNRIDSLRNIVRDGRVSLMFMVPGCQNVVRVNGRAILTDDHDLRQSFAKKKTLLPATVTLVTVGEAYVQCAKALMRSRLWNSENEASSVPTVGQFIAEFKESFDAPAYDDGYADYAKDRMW